MATERDSSSARVSLLAIVSVILPFFPSPCLLPELGNIGGPWTLFIWHVVITLVPVIAMSGIRRSRGTLKGGEWAMCGLILAIAWWFFWALVFLIFGNMGPHWHG